MHKLWSLGLELQVSSLGVLDEVSVSSRNFNQVSVSKVTVWTTWLPPRTTAMQTTATKNDRHPGNRHLGHIEFFAFIAIQVFEPHKDVAYNKNFFILRPL